jgi:hypothetical protein
MSAEGIDGTLIRPTVRAPVYAFHVAQEDDNIVSIDAARRRGNIITD